MLNEGTIAVADALVIRFIDTFSSLGTELVHIKVFTTDADYCRSMCFNHDGSLLMNITALGNLTIWNTETAERQLLKVGVWAQCAQFSPDSNSFVIGNSHVAKIFDSTTGDERCQLICDEDGNYSNIKEICFHNDGSRLLTGNYFGAITIFDTASGAVLGRYLGTVLKAVSYLSFNFDYNEVVSSSDDGTVRVWTYDHTAETSLSLSTCIVPGSRIFSISFDKYFRIAIAFDRHISIWDSRTGLQIMVCQGEAKFVRSMSFNYDGSKLAATSMDTSQLLIWSMCESNEYIHPAAVASAAPTESTGIVNPSQKKKWKDGNAYKASIEHVYMRASSVTANGSSNLAAMDCKLSDGSSVAPVILTMPISQSGGFVLFAPATTEYLLK